MSRIWRSIFEVEAGSEPQLVDSAENLFLDWIGPKFTAVGVEMPSTEEVREAERVGGGPIEASVREAEKEGVRAYRGILFEDRGAEHVRTTFTSIRDRDQREWAWTDLERWSSAPYEKPWVPSTPRIVTALTGTPGWTCRIGRSRIQPKPSGCRGYEDGVKLAKHLTAPDRQIPVVVVTTTFAENDLEGDVLLPALKRAHEILQRLTGIASVVAVDWDAAYGLRETLDSSVGADFGVWGGKIRTYWPALTAGDFPGRHRFHGYKEIEERTPEDIAQIVSRRIVAGSTHQLPPKARVDDVKPLMMGEFNVTQDEDLLLESIAKDDTIEALQTELNDVKLEYLEKAEELSHQVSISERLKSRLRELGEELDLETAVQGVAGLTHPRSCGELATLSLHLDYVSFPGEVWGPTKELDDHPENDTYALEAWSALLAMEDYGRTQANGGFKGDFHTYCKEADSVFSPNRVIMKESEHTGSNRQMRSARTFVAKGFEEPQFMEPHIRVRGNRAPAPRIHFLDDTRGATKKVHIGYFGKHLPTKSTN